MLDTLPSDICDYIASFIRWKDLIALSRVNKYLHKVLQKSVQTQFNNKPNLQIKKHAYEFLRFGQRSKLEIAIVKIFFNIFPWSGVNANTIQQQTQSANQKACLAFRIIVRPPSAQNVVGMHITTNGWKTTSKIYARFDPDSKSVQLRLPQEEWIAFYSFTKDDLLSKDFYASFYVRDASGETVWDNNNGKNWKVDVSDLETTKATYVTTTIAPGLFQDGEFDAPTIILDWHTDHIAKQKARKTSIQ